MSILLDVVNIAFVFRDFVFDGRSGLPWLSSPMCSILVERRILILLCIAYACSIMEGSNPG